jgi:urea transporter
MNRSIAWWEGVSARSAMLRFTDRLLRGIGQVMFQDNPLSGLLFFIAIGWGSWAAGEPEIAIGGLVALVAGTLTAQWLRVDAAGLNAGLYGFNAYLTGIALPTFMAPTPQLWVYVVLGGVVSVVVMLALVRVLKTWGVAVLTAPFVLVTWLLLLGTNAFAGLDGSALPPAGQIVPIDPAAASLLHPGEFLQGLLTSISQVFLKGHGPVALLLLAGLAVSSMPAALFALLGAATGLITAHALGAESQLITAGLLGFNPVLTAIALGAVFYRPSFRVVLYTLLATVLSVIVQGAMIAAMTPVGIPTLTAAFVLVTWLFLLPALKFE